ncbi:AAA family ATPase [Mycoplasma sp. ATU-Cv-703]|uniref:AAA family ATPase n=1 Tax=Mycoplasma sp. ATU-Cv-703 TaxID=2498595 RepID=UPI000FDE5774
MRINLHQHTLSIKNGESPNRNLDISKDKTVEKFISNLENWDVGIVAITNHNWFDLKQFNFLEKKLKEKNILLLPGVELDIEDSEGHRHNLTIIVDNKHKNEWSNFVIKLVEGKTKAKNCKVKISELKKHVQTEKTLFSNSIFLLPSRQKGNKKTSYEGDLPKEDLNILQSFSHFWFWETSSLSSTYILAFEEKPAILGSDEKDVLEPKYGKLPDIKLKIDSYHNLIKFFKRDKSFITSKLKEKNATSIEIKPKEWKNPLKLILYEDVNVIIGPRASGKSDILKAICEKIKEEKGEDYKVYDPNFSFDKLIENKTSQFSNKLDLEKKLETINFYAKNMEHLNSKSNIKNYKQIVEHYKNYKPNQYKKLLNLTLSTDMLRNKKDYEKKESRWSEFDENINHIKGVNKIIEKNSEDDTIKKHYPLITGILKKLFEIEFELYKVFYNQVNVAHICDKLFSEIKKLLEQSKMFFALPNQLGIHEKFSAREELFDSVSKVLNKEEYETSKLELGEVSDKKKLFVKRKYKILKGNKKDGYENLNKRSPKDCKNLIELIETISQNIWKSELSKFMVELQGWKNQKNANITTDDLVWFKNIIVDQNGNVCNPSSGEKQIIKLMAHLNEDKNYFFIDEPEQSLDQSFVNDKIVKIIRDKAKNNKTFVIVTHNANIGVRSLPYQTIYRELSEDGIADNNETYYGNPFLNEMTSINDDKKSVKWSDICSKILEGGKPAFLDRWNYYRGENNE